ncbi:hypothetical protein AVEN_96810-1, partial [Araneus ventricosus]
HGAFLPASRGFHLSDPAVYCSCGGLFSAFHYGVFYTVSWHAGSSAKLRTRMAERVCNNLVRHGDSLGLSNSLAKQRYFRPPNSTFSQAELSNSITGHSNWSNERL